MGRDIVRLPNGQVVVVQTPDQSAYNHPQFQQFPAEYQHYAPPQPLYDAYPRPRRRKKRRRRLSLDASPKLFVFSGFILSWFWCGVGAPGLTLLCWGLLAIYMFRSLKE